MKRKTLVAIIIIFTLVIVSLLVFTIMLWPKDIDKTMYGVKIKLGSDNINYLEDVEIEVYGQYSNNFLFGHKFVGMIIIDNEVITSEMDDVIRFGNDTGGGALLYKRDKATVTLRTYGMIFADKSFDEVIVLPYEKDSNNKGYSSWGSDDGSIIVTQAKNRKEAIKIANVLMADFIMKPLE